MTTKQFPERLQADIAASQNFSQALKRLRDGKSATPRSWVWEDKDPKWISDTWAAELQKLGENKDLKGISEWDLSKMDKFASQGEVAPFAERQETLSEYWNHLEKSSLFKDPLWIKAKAQAVKALGFNKTGAPRSVDAVIKKGLKEDKYVTSSGDPLFLKRKNPLSIAQASKAATDGSWRQFYPVLGSRASMGKTGTEARWIFMFPMCVNIVEQTFQQPIQEYIENRIHKLEFFAPWKGYDYVQRVISERGPQNALYFGCDYSKMDQHFNLYHALECYDVIKWYFEPQYWKDLKDSIEYTFTCDVVCPDGLIPGPHAMPSGSGWTNFLETMFNFIVKHYLNLKYHLFSDSKSSAMGIGDDQLYFFPVKYKIEPITKLIVDVFVALKLEANVLKQEVSYSVISFLQRRSFDNWSPYGIQFAGVYPTFRALTSLIYPEFYHNEKIWTKRTFALRCLMILENCVNHPLFKRFCQFAADGNDNIKEFAALPDAEILLTRHMAKKIANFSGIAPVYRHPSLRTSTRVSDVLIFLRFPHRRGKPRYSAEIPVYAADAHKRILPHFLTPLAGHAVSRGDARN